MLVNGNVGTGVAVAGAFSPEQFRQIGRCGRRFRGNVFPKKIKKGKQHAANCDMIPYGAAKLRPA